MSFKLELIVLFGVLLCSATAHYSGPFLFWGVDDLKDVEVPALEEFDDKFLRDLYSNSAAVVLFLRNGTAKLNADNYPSFRRIIERHQYVYSPQEGLSSNPMDYNVNAEVCNFGKYALHG